MVGISIWEQKENADSYNREKFSEVQQLLNKVLDGELRRLRRTRFPTQPFTRSPLTQQPEDDNILFNIPLGGAVSTGRAWARPVCLPTPRKRRYERGRAPPKCLLHFHAA